MGLKTAEEYRRSARRRDDRKAEGSRAVSVRSVVPRSDQDNGMAINAMRSVFLKSMTTCDENTCRWTVRWQLFADE
jgi:hypothetical protein